MNSLKLPKLVIIGGIWLFLGLIYSGQSFFYSLSVGREYLWQRSLFHSLVFCLEWGLLTPVVLRIVGKFRLDDKNFRRNILVHFVIGILIALAQQTVYVIVTDVVHNGFVLTKSFSAYLPSIVGFFEYGVLMYWSIVFVVHAVDYYRQYRMEEKHAADLKTQLVESQLQALKMQLQPHFLFNTLNAISVLIKKEPALAQKMIIRLGDLLRLTLERGSENVVTLMQELEFLNTYLAIEKVRFGDRLTVKMHIDNRALPLKVPTFVLQPLVENAVRHGIAKRSGAGWIEIAAVVNTKTLELHVIDGGKKSGKTKKNIEGFGVGLENTRSRLKQLYNTKATLRMEENTMNGYSTTMIIPLDKTLQQ